MKLDYNLNIRPLGFLLIPMVEWKEILNNDKDRNTCSDKKKRPQEECATFRPGEICERKTAAIPYNGAVSGFMKNSCEYYSAFLIIVSGRCFHSEP